MGTFGVLRLMEWVCLNRWRRCLVGECRSQNEGLLGCSLGQPTSEALAPSFAFDALDSGQATTANRNTVTKETESVKYSLLT